MASDSCSEGLPAVLRAAGVTESDKLMNIIMGRYLSSSVQMDLAKAELVLTHLSKRHGFSPPSLSLMIQRLPELLIGPTSIENIDEALDFLRTGFSLSAAEAREVAVRLPQVLTYSVTGHLQPHRSVLLSLLPETETEDQLKDLVMFSPQVLSPCIDLAVLHFNRRRIPRRLIGKILKREQLVEYMMPPLPLRKTAYAALSSILLADPKPPSGDEPDVYPL
jgi:hypothetical protein